jgi:cytochrome P450
VGGAVLLLWNAGSVGQGFVAGGRARLGLQSAVGAKVISDPRMVRSALSGLEADAVDALLLADAGPLDYLPTILGVLALGAAGAAAYLWNTFQGPRGAPRTDGFKDEELPPWADNAAVLSDTLSGKPFDEVLLNMRKRHGDAFRIFVPSLFGEVICLMGVEANQWVFNEKDKVLDQALGGVVGTAVSGKKTMGTKERKATESGKIFDKASTAFFSNKKALARATRIFLDSAEDFCDQMERELKPEENVFEKLWTYVVQTNADMLYGEGDNAGRIVCRTISSINEEGLFSPAVRKAGDDLRVVLDKSYQERVADPKRFEEEDSLFEEFFKLSKGEADEEMLQGLQQFMLTLQLAANGNQLVTIRWLMSHVYADPAILAGVREEVKAKIAEKGPGMGIRDLNLQDLLDLSLTNACITEAVRLHSDIPSKLTLRSAEEDMEFKGWKIPKGMTIFLYADAVHKDSKVFGPDPGAFCPQRYMDPEEWNRMQMDKEIVTFGHGRKRCTGELHARAQICALMASFALRFDMDLKTQMPGDIMPEDHDGPFVFDTANTLLLVNLRKQKIMEGADKVPVESAASLFGQRALAEQKAQLSGTAVEGEEAAAEKKGDCPFGFSKMFGKSEESR